MVHRDTHTTLILKKALLGGLFSLVVLSSGCGDDGGEGGGFGGTGGTLGGLGTTSILYIANSGSDNVSGYSINATSGILAPIPGSPFANVSGPSALAVSSNGFFAYVTNGRTSTVAAFRVSTEGALLSVPTTPSNPNPAPVEAAPGALAIAPNTKYVYVGNSGTDKVTAFTIEASGALTLIPQSAGATNPVSVNGADPAAIAITQNGQFLYVANSGSNDITAFSIGATGLLSLIAPSGTNTNPVKTSVTAPKGMAISPNGSFLYVANSSTHNVTVFQIGTNGLLTLVPPAGGTTNPIPTGGTTPNSIMISLDGRFLYSANGGGTISAFTIGSDRLLTLVPSVAGNLNPVSAGANASPVALTMSPDGRFLYVATNVTTLGGRVSAFTITPETGTLVPLTALIGNPFLAGTAPSAIATPGRP
ncbi:MAG: lactonase family protein [Nitrospira sp. CG24B]|nr:MAG: lactonase family protein [Nitrospira sp. CG24B]